MKRTVCFALATAASVVPALAQGFAPYNVHDCTAIRDPVLLRQCLDSFHRVHGPIPPDPQTTESLMRAAGPIPGRPTARGHGSRSLRHAPHVRNPAAIEQVGPK